MGQVAKGGIHVKQKLKPGFHPTNAVRNKRR